MYIQAGNLKPKWQPAFWSQSSKERISESSRLTLHHSKQLWTLRQMFALRSLTEPPERNITEPIERKKKKSNTHSSFSVDGSSVENSTFPWKWRKHALGLYQFERVYDVMNSSGLCCIRVHYVTSLPSSAFHGEERASMAAPSGAQIHSKQCTPVV